MAAKKQQESDPGIELSTLMLQSARRLNSQREALDELLNPEFVPWIDELGLKVDNKAFSWKKFEFLRKPYADNAREVCIQKAAQMGFSIRSLLKMLHRSLILAPIKTGYFLPTQPKAAEFSTDRFDPLIHSIPKINAIMAPENVRNVHMKQLGISTIYFTYTEGKATTESTPMDYLIFDEVRRMNRERIATARERLSASDYKFIDFVSTAGYPGEDINYYFERSTQNEWWVKCPRCNVAFLPHEEPFPLHVMQNTEGQWGIGCIKCGLWGIDPQQHGFWVESYPGRERSGYHISQLISRTIPIAEVMEAFFSGDNPTEFYQSKLGIPWVDADAILVRQSHLDACVDTSCQWGVNMPLSIDGTREGFKQVATVMGIDQQQGYNVVVVKEVQSDGTRIVRHLEYVYADEPFHRCAELMREFDVDICVSDGEPNFNSARSFCRQFKGRAWMARYGQPGIGMDAYASWGDKLNKKEQATEGKQRKPWEVVIDRVSGMEWSLQAWAARMNRVPNPRALTQRVRPRHTIDPSQDMLISRETVKVATCADLFFEHLKRLAKERKAKMTESGLEVVGQATFHFRHIGIDPHFAHANLYADIAALRAMKLAKANTTTAEIWYRERPAKGGVTNPNETDSAWRDRMVEIDGFKVAQWAAEDVVLPEDQSICFDCRGTYWWADTREMYREGNSVRICLNCLPGKRTVEPLVDPPKQPYDRRERTSELTTVTDLPNKADPHETYAGPEVEDDGS